MAETKKGFFDKLWDVFSSVKTAIVIFALIAVPSIVGTIIEQNADQQKNLTVIAKFVGETNAPAVYKALESLGFMDMYHSWWFVTMLMLFALNLIVCSVDRIPPVWRAYRDQIKPLKDEQFAGFPIKREIALKGTAADVKPKLMGAMKALGFGSPHDAAEANNGYQLYADRHPVSRLGVYITHLSILVILFGAVAGVFLGFKGFVNIPEGSAYPMAFGRNNLTEAEFDERETLVKAVLKSEGDLARAANILSEQGFGQITAERLDARLRKLGVEPLPFAVVCDNFDVNFYYNSDMPKEYASDLIVYEKGREMVRKHISVNDPLKYKGYIFYQSNYGMYGEPEDYRYMFKVTPPGGQPSVVTAKLGQSFTVPGVEASFKVVDFSPALRFDSSGQSFTYSEMMNNPAARLQITSGSDTHARWVMKRRSDTWNIGIATVEFIDARGAQYTGLQVRRDPGVWLVYLGCVVMAVGLYMTFFMSHRRIWIRVAPSGKGGSRVTISATAHKHRDGFERQVQDMIARLEGGKQ